MSRTDKGKGSKLVRVIQQRFCETCWKPFTPSRRYIYICKQCQKSAQEVEKYGKKHFKGR